MNSITQVSPTMAARPLTGRVALVTGSTSGIGLAVLEKLASEGADVVMNGFGDPTAIEAIRTGLEVRYSVRVRYDGADMSKPEEIEAMVEAARVARSVPAMSGRRWLPSRSTSRRPPTRSTKSRSCAMCC
jgi:hypothetical protein